MITVRRYVTKSRLLSLLYGCLSLVYIHTFLLTPGGTLCFIIFRKLNFLHDNNYLQVPVRHLVFMVHGIGQRLEKSNLVDDVGNFRHITASLAEQHLTPHQRGTQRVLFIPCQVLNMLFCVCSEPCVLHLRQFVMFPFSIKLSPFLP